MSKELITYLLAQEDVVYKPGSIVLGWFASAKFKWFMMDYVHIKQL